MTAGPGSHRAAIIRHGRGLLAYGAGPALGLLSGPVLARALDADGRGQFAAIMQPITVAGAIASIGIPAAATFFVAGGRSTPRRVLRIAGAITLPVALLTYAGMVCYAIVVAEAQDLSVWAVILCWSAIVAAAFVQVRRGFWAGLSAWRRLDAERLLFAVLRFAAVVVLALIGIRSATGFAAGALAAFAIAATLLWLPRYREPTPPAAPSVPLLAPMIRYSAGAALGTITLVANNRLDQVLMPAQTDSRQLGLYAVAVTVAEVPMIVATLAARQLLTSASRGSSVREMSRALMAYSGAVAASAAALGSTAHLFAPVLFGAEFAGAAESIRLLSVSTVLGAAALMLSTIITGRGLPLAGSASPAIGLAVTVALFVAGWGGIDAHAASVIAIISQAASLAVAAAVLIVVTRLPGRDSPPSLSRIEETVP